LENDKNAAQNGDFLRIISAVLHRRRLVRASQAGRAFGGHHRRSQFEMRAKLRDAVIDFVNRGE
jgi:hypothetical protein